MYIINCQEGTRTDPNTREGETKKFKKVLDPKDKTAYNSKRQKEAIAERKQHGYLQATCKRHSVHRQ